MAITPYVGMKVRFHLGASVIEERHTFAQNIQKACYVGEVVEVFGKDNRFAKIRCPKIGDDPVVVDKEAIFSAIKMYKYVQKEGNSPEALAFKFNQNRNR